jgi:ABC-type spermidine/putrescine transport system permease subunit I
VRRRLAARPDRYLLLVPLAFLSALLLYPLVDMVRASFDSPVLFGWYRAVFADDVFVSVVVRTFALAAGCSIAALLLGFPIAYEITRPRTRMRSLLLLFILMTFWISLLPRAYSWVVVLQNEGLVNDVLAFLGFDRQRLYGNIYGVAVGITHFLLPYMVAILVPVIRGIDRNVVNAAHSLGASKRRTMFRIVVPLSLGGIAAGVLLTFILSLGFFVMPAILGGPGVQLLPSLIADQVGIYQNFGQAAALSVVLTGIVILIYLLLIRVLDPGRLLGDARG